MLRLTLILALIAPALADWSRTGGLSLYLDPAPPPRQSDFYDITPLDDGSGRFFSEQRSVGAQ
jgi:hypothetical protein